MAYFDCFKITHTHLNEENKERPTRLPALSGNSVNGNLMAVFGIVKKKAANTFHSNLIDVEVQMLPKTCTAIQRYIAHKNGQAG
jgi:hypothetical protein